MLNDESVNQPSLPNKFVQFGCWNNTNKGGLEAVMKQLKSYVETERPNFIVVSGDNYYPSKQKIGEDKVKTIDANQLKKGLDLLTTSAENVPIYMILGNHDLETNIPTNRKLYINNELDQDNACSILDIEFDNINNIDYTLFNSIMLAGNTLLLMVDTSIYDADAPKFLACYNKYFERKGINIDKFENIEKIQNYQENLISEAINKATIINNIIIVGHHPITGLKFKEADNKKGKPAGIRVMDDIPQFKQVLTNTIYPLVESKGEQGRSPNYYYLCSDLHLYQDGVVTLNNNMRINQYIVGTGGTELDPASLGRINEDGPPMVPNMQPEGTEYEMHNEKTEYGFLECTIDENNVNFKFILAPRSEMPIKKDKDKKDKNKNKPLSDGFGGSNKKKSKKRNNKSKKRNNKSKKRNNKSKKRNNKSKRHKAV